jgi:hypothetical protein
MTKFLTFVYTLAFIFVAGTYAYWTYEHSIYSPSLKYIFIAGILSGLLVLISPFAIKYLRKRELKTSLKLISVAIIFHSVFTGLITFDLIEVNAQINEHFNQRPEAPNQKLNKDANKIAF